MSQGQYANMITSVFGADLKVKIRFPFVPRKNGMLALGASSAGVTPATVEQFQQIAGTVATQVVGTAGRRNYVMPCQPASSEAPDPSCATQFFKTTGRLLYRRAMTDAEVARLVTEAGQIAHQYKDFYYGLSMVLAGILVDPRVLYIEEQTEPDPQRPAENRLTSYALATRLSLLLWNSPPDGDLLDAAERGDLYTRKGRERVVDRMIASPRFVIGVRAFFDDMLAFDDFDNLAKDPTIYPNFSSYAARDAREQTLLMIVDHLITKNGDYRDLLTTRSTFLTPDLAAVYGMPSQGPGWTPYELPVDGPWAGLLTQAAFLSVHSHPGRSSPTKRGRALREELLCQKVPDPPPNVDFSAVEDPKLPLKTARERLDFHSKTPACAGCHKITDPIGLALESFDGTGKYRTSEKGVPIDTSGRLSGKDFTDAVGLSKVIRDDPALTSCLVKRMYEYAAGGPTAPSDKAVLAYFNERFALQGYTVPALMKTIALSSVISDVSEQASPASAQTAQGEGR